MTQSEPITPTEPIGGISGQIRRLLRSRLLSTAIIGGVMTLGVKGIAFLKELIVAKKFGTSDEIDAFLMAAMIPTVLAFMVGDAFRDAVLPVYAERRVKKAADAQRLVSSALWVCAGFLIVAGIVTILFSGPLMQMLAPEFSPEKQQRAAMLLCLLTPFIVCQGLSGVMKGYLQVHDRFALSSAAPAIIPVTVIGFLLLGSGRGNANELAIGTSLGALLVLVLLFIDSARIREGKLSKRPVWTQSTPPVMRSMVPLLAGAAVMEGCFFVDMLMAATLPAGSVATLTFGERICTIVLAIGGTAAGQALFPRVADLAARQEWRQMTSTVFRFSGLLLVVCIPCVVVFQIWSEPIVRMLFERGKFTPQDTINVAEVLRFAAFQIPGYILAVMGARVMIALKLGSFLFVTTIVSLAANVLLNLLFMDWYGVKGIALSTAVVGALSAAMYYGCFLHRVRKLQRESRAESSPSENQQP